MGQIYLGSTQNMINFTSYIRPFMKILVFIDHFQFGGAARVTASMCNGLADAGYEVSLAMDSVNYSVSYPLDERVKVVPLVYSQVRDGSGLKKLGNIFRLVAEMRNIVKERKPDIVIAVLHSVYFFVKIAMCGMNIPIIACDHTSFEGKPKSLRTRFVRSYLYGKADALSILTKRDEKILGDRFPNKQVIYNPLPFETLKAPAERRMNILCAGRLDAWDIKGFDTMITVWGKLAGDFPGWILEIAGDGSKDSYERLEAMVDAAGLDGRVRLLGQVGDMKGFFAETGIFSLPSRVEGFPMVLMEALSQGCPCVTFELGGAAGEMISGPMAGLIVPDGDAESFAEQLRRLLEDESLRRNMSENAVREVERFSQDRFVREWVNLIEKVYTSR